MNERSNQPNSQSEAPASEPFWHAIVSESCPAINRTVKRADVADEEACRLRETYPDVEVIPLYRAALGKQPTQEAPADAKDAPRKKCDYPECDCYLSEHCKTWVASKCRAIDALRYYRDHCTGAEPSISVFHQMLDSALQSHQEGK